MQGRELTYVGVLFDIVYGRRAAINVFERTLPSFDLSTDGGYLRHKIWQLMDVAGIQIAFTLIQMMARGHRKRVHMTK